MVDHKFINPAPDLSDSSLEKWYKSEYQNMCDLYCEGDVFRLSYLKDYSFYLSEYMRAYMFFSYMVFLKCLSIL